MRKYLYSLTKRAPVLLAAAMLLMALVANTPLASAHSFIATHTHGNRRALLGYASQPITISIQTSNGHFLTAVNGGSVNNDPGNQLAIHTDATQIGPWEHFFIDPVLGTGNTNTFAIETINGFFLTAVNGGGINGDPGNQLPIHTDATHVGSWELFQLIPLSGGGAAIKTINGHFLTAVNGGGVNNDPGNQLPIHTDATHVGPWEVFILPLSNS